MLSVVIPTRNRAELLVLALESLMAQQMPFSDFEVLVIDNSSRDETPALVKAFGGRLSSVRYFHEPVLGLHAGRHRGLKEASGDILVFADDDIRATPGWLAAIAKNFTDPEVVMVGGNNYPDFKAAPPPWLEQLWHQRCLGGQAITSLSVLSLPAGRYVISPYMVWGCNFSIRKSVLLDAGGFHPDAMPQDLIRFRGDGETHVSRFVADRGLRCMFDSRASVYHAVTEERMTLEYFRRRAYNQGVSDSYTQLRGGRDSNDSGAGRRSPVAFVRRIADRAYAKLQEVSAKPGVMRELHRVIREGHKAGFTYHRTAYQQDEEVRDWVHKPHYF